MKPSYGQQRYSTSGRFQSALQVLEVIFQADPDFPSAGPLHLAILGKR
jgi:hypothetical protein